MVLVYTCLYQYLDRKMRYSAMSENINAKYVVMIETNRFPDAGNCDNCEFHCSYYMSTMDKLMESDKILTLNQFYCPIRACVVLEEYNKWKQEGKTHEETAQITVKSRESEDL